MTNRILWNTFGENIDEIVLRDVHMIHVEQMDDRCWWIGITLNNGGYWSGIFQADSRGHMTFNEQDMCDFTWDLEDSHNQEGT